MLPNKMRISEHATNSLRRLQSNTGLTVNIGARLAFFTSIERGYRFNPKKDVVEHTGRELDKHTWLGSHSALPELLLKQYYPEFSMSQFHDAWVAHVEDGSNHVVRIANLKASLAQFSN